MENRKRIIVITVFTLCCIIIDIFLMNFMKSFTEKELAKHQSGHIIMTMQDFGYQENHIENCEYWENAKFGKLYELTISNGKTQVDEKNNEYVDETYVSFEIDVYDIDERHDFDDVLRRNMLETKQHSYWDPCSYSSSFCIKVAPDRWNKENIFDYYYNVSEIYKDADAAYMLYEDDNYPSNTRGKNYIYLVKDRRIVTFSYSIYRDFSLSEENVAVIEGLLYKEIK